MFTDAEIVEIGGKEVQSIILEDGGILYEKNRATAITLSSEDNIIGAGDTTTFTATLDYPISDQIITFLIGENSVSAQTDSNGQATITYTGQGAGDITITATYLNLSNSITIQDMDVYDTGDGNWYSNSKYIIRTIENGEILVSDTHPSSANDGFWYMYPLPRTSTASSMSEANIWETDIDYCFEMDIINSSDSETHIELRPQASGLDSGMHLQSIGDISNNTACHLKIIVSDGISYWFVNDNIKPFYIQNSHDLGELYSMRIALHKQQTITVDNIMVYKLNEKPNINIPEPYSISVSATKTILSATNNESCILNATVLDENNNPVQNQEVTFKLGTTILNTTLTDENGEATYEFEAKGNGNISVSAEVGELSSNSLTIEDCIYAKMQQYDIVRSGSTKYGLLNDDVISDLPTQYSIELSMKTSMHPASGAEHRLYWVPRELYNNENQPSYAMFLGFSTGLQIQFGVRRGNTSCVERRCSIDSWYNFKVDKLSDRFNYYNNGIFIDWYSFGYQYNNWTFSYIMWSDTTLSVKDIKIKPFEFNDTISIEYSETETNYTLTATLTGNDIANRAVRFCKNNKYIGTSFTNSNGIATKTFDEIETEDISFTAWCGNVESSEVIVENDINTPKIRLSANKNILSYTDNESCTITATYQGEVVNGQTVVFKNGETVLATKTTNSNGVATYEYESQGVGDVTITAECMNLQETYDIEDCWNTQLPEVSAGSNTVNSIGMDNVHNVQNDDFILEFDHKGNGNICIGATSQYSTPSTANYRLTLGTYDSKYYCAVRTSSTDETSGSSEDNSTYYSYKIEKEGTTVKFYANNVLIATKTASFFTNYDAYSIYNIKWGGGTDYMKNIRLKPL